MLPGGVMGEMRLVASWDGFALMALLLTWLRILTLRPTDIARLAKREDPGRLVSLALVVLGASAALLGVVVLLQQSMRMAGTGKLQAIALALSAVALGWALIHTVFTLRYAHEYYDAPDGEPELAFPGRTDAPDYLDFAYFAFVIGMTSQTSDVAIQGTRTRRTVLLHGVLSFGFNTAVLALTIGALTALL
jgi:uncharacterized membrane protein